MFGKKKEEKAIDMSKPIENTAEEIEEKKINFDEEDINKDKTRVELVSLVPENKLEFFIKGYFQLLRESNSKRKYITIDGKED